MEPMSYPTTYTPLRPPETTPPNPPEENNPPDAFFPPDELDTGYDPGYAPAPAPSPGQSPASSKAWIPPTPSSVGHYDSEYSLINAFNWVIETVTWPFTGVGPFESDQKPPIDLNNPTSIPPSPSPSPGPAWFPDYFPSIPRQG